jgi:hypothetical protein
MELWVSIDCSVWSLVVGWVVACLESSSLRSAIHYFEGSRGWPGTPLYFKMSFPFFAFWICFECLLSWYRLLLTFEWTETRDVREWQESPSSPSVLLFSDRLLYSIQSP